MSLLCLAVTLTDINRFR